MDGTRGGGGWHRILVRGTKRARDESVSDRIDGVYKLIGQLSPAEFERSIVRIQPHDPLT